MIESWAKLNRAYFELSDEGKARVKDAAVGAYLHLTETCPIPKVFNTPCPHPNCDSMLPILESQSEMQLCACRNYNVYVAWKDDGPIVGLVSPVVHEEEL